ncbi:MAG: UDP-N-acetylmuramate dehydrogenase [Bradymonadales bacterium]|nr:UDP-N-acetylmuramate dehydrogenase [Bradymonadales bacterium]
MGHGKLISREVPLHRWTTLGVGGPARFFAQTATVDELCQVLRFAAEQELEPFILGQGSNLVVADDGYPGVVIRLTGQSVQFFEESAAVRVEAEAGLSWDDLVRMTVERDLAGLECLSGIPGTVGAAPIQNIGAYGQEVSETLTAIELLDRNSHQRLQVDREGCGFGYRTSRFKGEWKGRYVILGVALRLRPGGEPRLRYEELARRAREELGDQAPTLSGVRQLVLDTRRKKAMLYDAEDPDSRSAGSFFLNPVVQKGRFEHLSLEAKNEGWGAVPSFQAGEGQVKLSAAWLIERAGFVRGTLRGRAGLSTRHALAITNRGGATAEEIIGLALEIKRAVKARFGICLLAEPELLGFAPPVVAELKSGPTASG